MTPVARAESNVTVSRALDDETRALVRVAAVVAAGDESDVRRALVSAHEAALADLVEEVILQSYLFAGFPRALNAAREWRRISGRAAPSHDEGERFAEAADWSARGEATCAAVYGPFYERLRANIRALHPALDAWMIVEGYGKVLSRSQLDLVRRELCIVAACALARQDRQLHSHLHGALHVGATEAQVEEALETITDLLTEGDRQRYQLLWSKVRGTNTGPVEARRNSAYATPDSRLPTPE